ncbi:MAG TPA: hypothetical protein VHC21_02730 [Candidatus Saccharimonadales bacterium]|nr:hypothetical protein [Candidatus Saccharimonadales bacterium]
MLAVSFFSWWYGRGWRQVAASFTARLRRVAATFSVSQLLRTLFAPWRRIISYPGASLGERFRAWGDNLFSRAVGFVVRLVVLFTALLVSVVVVLFSLIELIVWPLLPIAAPVLIIVGLV